MASLIAQIPDLSEVTGMVGQTITAAKSIKQVVEQIDKKGIADLSTQVASVAIPNAADWVAPLVGGLQQVAALLPPGGGDTIEKLLSSLNDGGDKIAGPLYDQVIALVGGLSPILSLLDSMNLVEQLFTQVLPTLTGIKDKIATVGSDFGAILGKLVDIMGDIPAIDDTPILADLKQSIGRIHALLVQDGTAFGAYLVETVSNLSTGLDQPFSVPLQEALARAQTMATALQVENIKSQLSMAENAYEGLLSLDISSVGGLGSASMTVNKLRSDIDQLAGQIQAWEETAQTTLADLGLSDLRFSLESALYTLGQALRVGESQGAIGKFLDQIRRYIQHMDLEGISESIRKQLEGAKEALKILDWSTVEQPLRSALEALKTALDSLEQSLIEITVKIGSALEQVGKSAENLDTEAALQAIQQGGQQASAAAQQVIDKVASTISQVASLIDDLISQIGQVKLGDLKQELENLMSQLLGVLHGPEAQKVLEGLTTAVQEIEAGLAGITFTPVFDQVNGEIAAQKEKLAKVDVSQLNPILRAALAAAIEALKQTDLAGEVTQKLKSEFTGIMDLPTKAVEAVRKGFQVVSERVSSFDPVRLAVEPLKSPLEEAREIIGNISPGALLSPLEKAFNDVTSHIGLLDTGVLLTPVKDLHSKALSVMDSFDPSKLVDLLRQGVAKIADQLDRLPLKAVSDKLDSFTGRMKGLIDTLPSEADPMQALNLSLNLKQLLDKVDPAVFSTAADGFINQFTAKLDNINLAVVQPAFKTLADQVSTFQQRLDGAPISDILTELYTKLSGMDPLAVLSRAQTAWAQSRRAVEASIVPAGGEADRTALLSALDEAAPAALLTAAMGKISGLIQSISTVGEEVMGFFREVKFSQELLSGRLQTWVIPNPDQQALKSLISSALHSMLIAPIEGIVQDLAQRKQGWQMLLEAFDELVDELRTRVLGLTAIPSLLKELAETATGISGRMRNLDVSAISQGLKSSYGSIRQKIADLDPALLESEIQKVVTSLSDGLAKLYPKTQVEALDAEFQLKIIAPLADWDPERLIGEPLKALKSGIDEALKRLDVDQIFDALLKGMSRLEGELDTGLDGTNRAFDDLLSASPI
jgi:hypothetical protein